MKKILTIFICSMFYLGFSQNISITYENPLGIEIFGSEEIYHVFIQNNTENIIDENSILEVNLPVGITYVDNSVSSNFIGTSVLDVNNPEFITINAIAVGEIITLEFKAEAKCNSYAFIDDNLVAIKNGIKYSYSIGGVNQSEIILNETDSYNLSFSDVSLELPLEILGQDNQTLEFNSINESLTQSLHISIPGNSAEFSSFQINVSPTSELEFMGISELIIGTTSYSVLVTTIIAPVAPSTTTNLIFKASDIDTILSNFSANMLIKVKLNFRAKSCFVGNSQHVEYESIVGGINIDDCAISKIFGDFQFRTIAPSLTYSFNSDKKLNFCGETSAVEYTITNSIDASGPAYDIHLLLNSNYGSEISNIRINDIPVETSIYTSGNDSMVHLLGDQFFDLTDEDNDGEIDDLAPGASITVKCDVSLILSSEYFSLDNCDNGFHETYFQSEFYSLSSECDTVYSTDNDLYSIFQLIESSNSNNLQLNVDLDLGESNHVQFCFNRNKGGYENQIFDDTMLLDANIILPCGTGVDLNFQPIFTTDSGIELSVIPTTLIIDDKLVLNLKVIDPYIFSDSISTYGGCFEFDLLLDSGNLFNCTNTESLLEGTVYGAFSECPNQKINLGCDQKQLYLHYIPLFPSCPNEYTIMATSFNAIRTSYGTYSDGSQITIEGVESGEFQNLNTNGAYASDTIRTDIVGKAVCDVGSDEIFYGYIWFSHPENIPILTMTQAEYSIGLSDPIITSDFSYRDDLSTSIKTVYEVKVSGEQVNKYDAVKISGYFLVDKSINNNTEFPDVYSIAEFRGGINSTSNLPESPYHYGTNFEVYGLDYFGGLGGSPATCSSYGDFYMSFHVKGGFQDDFPNEFRNVIQIIGPIEVIIPAAINDNIVLISAEYAVSGIYNSSNLSINPVEGNSGVFRIYDSEYGELEEFRPFDKTSTIMYCSIRFRLSLNDCSLSEEQTIDVLGAYLEQGYAEEPLKEMIETNYPTRIVSNGSGFNTGDLNLDIVNPFFQTIGTVTRYKIDVDNINPQQAKHPWIKFTYPDNLISINNSAINGYDIVGSVYDTNTLLLKLQPINAGCGMEGYIDITLNDCEFDDQYVDIHIETGISCEPISDDIFNNDGIVCPLDTDKKVQLEIIKSNLRMDVIPLFDSSVPLQYCDSFQYIVQIFNNEKANITSPSFQVDVPNGFEMSVQYLYPVLEAIDATNSQFINTGFSSPIDIVSGQLWGLEETNGVLPGYIANQSDYLNNYYQLLVTLTPTCGYDGVSSINFSASGITNCNEEKEITFQSTPTFLELDALNNYSLQLSMDVQQNVGLSNYTATVHYVPNTDILDSLGILTVNLPAGIYSTDNLNFTLPSSGGTDFIFDFTTDPEYCGDVSFLINTIIDIGLGCNTNTTCVRRFELQNTLTEYICIQECIIKSVEVETIIGLTCLNYNLNVVPPVVSYGDIISYDWVITDINNNLIGNYSGNEIEVDLPNVGMPFTTVLTVVGMNINGSVCKAEKIVTLTPSCEQCDIKGELTISRNSNDVCNSIVLIPNITVYNGEITSYLWSLYDEQGNELETIHSNTIIPEFFIYEFLENGVYSVCLEINSSNILGETCSKQICKEVIINCTPCSVDAKFSSQKISDCIYQFNNHSIVSNWIDVEYLWDFGDGNTSTEFEPRHTYTTTGSNNVYLTVTALNSTNVSCESTFGPMKIEANSCFQDEGCLDITDTTDIDVFPNPNNGIFTLSFNSCIKSSEVRVYDALGKIIYYKIMRNDNKVFIDIPNCAKGVYFVKVSSNTMSKTKRIIIE
ncbi:MAG: hypothetical protein COA88_10040 [Kordia sp.]|nr:MAG: hypothetical protein COA88_10040 [Kordia sp.]